MRLSHEQKEKSNWKFAARNLKTALSKIDKITNDHNDLHKSFEQNNENAMYKQQVN